MSQLWFELYIAIYGAWAMAQAWLADLSEAAGALMTLAIIVIGLGCLFAKIKFLARILFIIGGLGFVVAMLINGIFSHPLGNDPSATVAATAGILMRGGFPGSVVGSRTSVYLSAPVSTDGHRLVAINRVGCSSLSAAAAAAKVGEDLDAFFPIRAVGQNGKDVARGHVFLLGVLPLLGGNPVVSEGPNGHYFPLTAMPHHWLQGTANHGFVKDASGQLWMFQYGTGPTGEPNWKQRFNYSVAKMMWERMAQNAASQLVDCQGSALPVKTPPVSLPPQPRSAADQVISWDFTDGLEDWSAQAGTPQHANGIVWVDPQTADARFVSPTIAITERSAEIELGVSSSCAGPLDAEWLDTGGRPLGAKTQITTAGCDRCGVTKFLKYRASLPSLPIGPVRLGLRPCTLADQSDKDQVGFDFVRIRIQR